MINVTARVCAAITVVIASIALLTPSSIAGAHPMPHTSIVLDVQDARIDAEFRLPLDDLALASGIDLRSQDPLQSVDVAQRDRLGEYLAAHTTVRSIDGREWTVVFGNVELSDVHDPDAGRYREAVARGVLTPPSHADVRRFTFAYEGIVGEVATHEALVSVGRDFGAGHVDRAGRNRLLGTVRTDSETMTVPALQVDLDDASAWAGFLGMLELGAHHILAGTDHLLFLFSLLLMAPLVAVAGRWQRHAGFRRAVRRTGAITAAFTAGHSVALVLSALTQIAFPERPIEILIALSVFVTGMHAIRPLFPGREVVVASLFGLIHGMAFSFTLADLQLSSGQLALSVLGFNMGIEAAQILLILLVLPPLLLLAATRWQSIIRVAIAVTATVAATGWALDRAGVGNVVATAANQLSTITPLGIALFAAAVTAPATLLLWQRTRRSQERSVDVSAQIEPRAAGCAPTSRRGSSLT